jgi:hypothetical protein
MPVEQTPAHDYTHRTRADLQALMERAAFFSAYHMIAASRESIAQSRELMLRADEILTKGPT